MALGGALADFHSRSSLLDGESCEVAELHKSRLLRIPGSEEVERFVDGQQFVLGLRSGDLDLIHVHPRHRPAAAEGMSPAGSLDQDPPHRLGGGAEKMGAIFENLITETQPCLMDEGGRLERVALLFARHLGGSKLAELSVDQRDQIAGGVVLTAADGMKQERHVTWPSILQPARGKPGDDLIIGCSNKIH